MKHCPRRRIRMQNTLILMGWDACVAMLPDDEAVVAYHATLGVWHLAGRSAIRRYTWPISMLRRIDWDALRWHQVFIAYRAVMRAKTP